MLGVSKKNRGIDLATFVGGLVRALTKGQQALPKARREQIEKHFDKNADGQYVPKMLDFKLNESQQVSVPSYCLSRVNNIGIDSAIIKCSAKLVDIEQKQIDCELSDHTHQVKYYVQPANRFNSTFDIEIKFNKRMDSEPDQKLTEFLIGLIEVVDS